MDLYLIRHADALPLGEGGASEDSDRPLSEAGKAQAHGLATALQRCGVHPALVLCSPALRAKQTAEEMLAKWSGTAPPLKDCEELALGGRARKLANAIRRLGSESMALVGHQPDLCQFAAWLIGSRKAQIDLAKAGVACIRCVDEPSKGGGVLNWLVTPVWFGTAKA